MASIFTGLAFMHGHIVDRELIFRLGREETAVDRGAGSRQPTTATLTAAPKVARELPVRPACATC
jgi:hypothetical protein